MTATRWNDPGKRDLFRLLLWRNYDVCLDPNRHNNWRTAPVVPNPLARYYSTSYYGHQHWENPAILVVFRRMLRQKLAEFICQYYLTLLGTFGQQCVNMWAISVILTDNCAEVRFFTFSPISLYTDNCLLDNLFLSFWLGPQFCISPHYENFYSPPRSTYNSLHSSPAFRCQDGSNHDHLPRLPPRSMLGFTPTRCSYCSTVHSRPCHEQQSQAYHFGEWWRQLTRAMMAPDMSDTGYEREQPRHPAWVMVAMIVSKGSNKSEQWLWWMGAKGGWEQQR